MIRRALFRSSRFGDSATMLSVPLLLLGLLIVSATLAEAQVDTTLVQAVVEIDIDGGPKQVVPAVSYNSTMLVPFRSFLEMSEIPLLDLSPDVSAAASIQPGNITVRFRPDSGYYTRDDSVFTVNPLEAVWWDGELYLATGLIDRVFGVTSYMEWSSLTVLVGQTSALPIIRRLRRERRHRLLDAPAPATPSAFSIRPPLSLADGAVFEWSITSPTDGTANDLTLATGLGAKLFGGSIELRHRLRNTTASGASDLRLSWERAWPQREWVRQVRIGDVQSNGLRARLIRGLVVTNAPFIRSSEFDVEQVLGRLPAGWEVELYERGRLRGYDEVDALGVFRVPIHLRYGQNPFELVLYGPGGEVVRETRTVRVPYSRIPKGELEYAVAGGSCRYGQCRGVFSADLRYGLTRWITVQGGSDLLSIEGSGDLWQPYAAVSAAPLRFLSLTGEAVYNDRLRGSVGVEPTPSFRLDFSQTLFDEAGSVLVGGAFERTRTEGSLFWQPHGALGSVFFQLVGFHSTGPAGKQDLQRLSATARIGRVRHSLGLRHDFTQLGDLGARHRSGVDWTTDFVVTGGPQWLRKTSVRGGLGLDASDGLSRLRAAIGRQIVKKARVDFAISWVRNGGYSIDIGLNSTVSGPRFGTRNRFNTQGGTDGLMFVDGSIVYDPDTRDVRLSDGRDIGRAGVSGVVFLDENDNRVQDPGERGLPGIPLVVAGRHEETDAMGRFATWELLPYEDSFIEVDPLSFDDPRLVPLNNVLAVSPTPNSYQTVHVPIVVGAEISGYVVLDGEGIPGVPVVLRNLTIGRTITLVTFSDGGFYSVSIPPGEYKITVPEEILDRLGAAATEVEINIPSGQGDKRIEELLINLERTTDEPGLLDRFTRGHSNQARRPNEEKN